MDQTMPNNMQAPSGHMIKYGIPFLRIAFGLWFLYHEAYEKIHAWTPETLPKLFKMWAENPQGYGFYKSFLLNFAFPNASFFTHLVTSWEFVLGICLVLGLGIRIVAPLQIFANINYILGKTYASGGANLDRLTIIILVTLFLVSAGREYGLDGRLRKKLPKLKWL